MLIREPYPRVIIDPSFPLQLSCVLYDASTHHFIIDSESTLMVIFMCFLPFIYFKQLFNFIQASSSGFFTLVVKNSSVVCIALLYLGDIYISYSVAWWKAISCSSGIYTASDLSIILNKWSPYGDVDIAPISSGNYSKIFPINGIMPIFTFPFSEK